MKESTKQKIQDSWDRFYDDDISTERLIQMVSDDTGFDVDVIVRAVFLPKPEDKP